MFLNAWQPGYSRKFAGWRILPHFYAPESWRLPVRWDWWPILIQKTRYEENSRRVELRSDFLDREFAQWQVVFNPVR